MHLVTNLFQGRSQLSLLLLLVLPFLVLSLLEGMTNFRVLRSYIFLDWTVFDVVIFLNVRIESVFNFVFGPSWKEFAYL